MHIGNKSNTEIKVLTFYDGDSEAIDAFADVIRYKMRQRIREEAETALADGEALLTRLKGSYNDEMREEKEP